MSEKNKILKFLIENDCDIMYFEASVMLTVSFKKKEARMVITLNKIDLEDFKKAFEDVSSIVPTYIKKIEN